MSYSRLYGVLCAFLAILFASSVEGGRVMNIGARIGCWAGAYDELQYVTADGRQWVDTGIQYYQNASDWETVEFDIIFNSLSGRELMLTNGNGYFGHNGTVFEFSSTNGSTVTTGVKYHVTTSGSAGVKSQCSITGVGSLVSLEKAELGGTYNSFLFSIYARTSMSTYAMNASLGRVRFDGTMGTKELIPVLKDGRAGFYDILNDEYLFSASGVDLIAGPKGSSAFT